MRSRHLLRFIAAAGASVLVAGCAKQTAISSEPNWPASSQTTISSDTAESTPIARTMATEPLAYAKRPGELGRAKGVIMSEPNEAGRKVGRRDASTKR